MLIECDDVKALSKVFKKVDFNFDENFKDNHDIFASTIDGTVYLKEDDLHYCVYVVFNRNNAQRLSLKEVAHECMHVIHFVYNTIGERFGDVNYQEHDAYLMGYLMNVVCEFLKIKTKIPRSKNK